MIRGISGGEKKRLTTGEMLVGPTRALFMDEISNGLDSSTTYEIVNSIKQSAHILQETVIISLLQPSPETYDLFDDIILLSDGQIVYQGPRENVLEFFEHLGFKCPERKGVADFLQEITSRNDQEQYWRHKDEPYRYVSNNDFCEAFLSSQDGQNLVDELSVPFDKEKSHPLALTTVEYGVSKKELLKACVAREYLLMKRNSLLYILRMIQIIVVASVSTTVFFLTEMHKNTIIDGGIYLGSTYHTLTVILLNGLSDLIFSTMKLPVFYKHRDLLLFPPWAYSLPVWILNIPVTLAEVSVWVCITYYTTGYDSDVGRFLKQLLVLICINQVGSGLFRLMGVLGRNVIIACTLASLVLLTVTVFGGYIISRGDINVWWIWCYWFSPLMYGQTSLAVNEFLGKSWSHIVIPGSTESLGMMLLKARGFFTEAHWYWIGVGALIGYIFLFNLLYTLALTYLNPFGKFQAIESEETLEKRNVPRKDKPMEYDVHMNSPSIEPNTTQADIINKKRGMILPFEPLSIAFDDIHYSVDMPQVQGNRLKLLKGVSGVFRPGVLTAVMGITGAGKTTLMDVLANRKTRGYIDGKITISGYPQKQETFARKVGYCEQTDIHSPHVTVYESLVFSAWLRLPPEVDPPTRKMFIEEVMDLVELTPLKEALVGLPGVNGLSIEQRKRLTIAVELVNNPSIIFMDEPTSGLDARTAATVMRTVGNTVNTGRTVVCTIHQPSTDIFYAFDELLLLKQGGEEIYVGQLGSNSIELIKYFEDIDGVRKIKDGDNPATWVMEITSTTQEQLLGINFAELYKNSEVCRKNKELVKGFSIPAPGSRDLYFPTRYSQSFWTQCKACLWKQHKSYLRNPPYTTVRLLYTTIITLMMGTIYWGFGTKRRRQQDIINAVGSMYIALTYIGVQNSITVQPIVANERTVFYRERSAEMYSAMPYAFGQIVIELPHILIQTLIYSLITYVMIGFEWIVSKFLWYIFFMYFTLLYFTFYGMTIVAITPNQNIAIVVLSAFLGIWFLFAGLFIPKTRIPVWWRWYYHLCPTAWSLYGLVASQYGDIQTALESNETVEQFITSYFGFRFDCVEYVAIIIVGITTLFGFGFAFAIRVLNFQKR